MVKLVEDVIDESSYDSQSDNEIEQDDVEKVKQRDINTDKTDKMNQDNNKVMKKHDPEIVDFVNGYLQNFRAVNHYHISSR